MAGEPVRCRVVRQRVRTVAQVATVELGRDRADDLEVLRGSGEGELRSVFGLVVEALRVRRERGTAPFTVMSCDNIQGNGDTAALQFVAFAELVDPELAAWIRENVPFPNSMVDRITPVTTDADPPRMARNRSPLGTTHSRWSHGS